MHYNRFRYYDNDVGMFISRDPIGLIGGDNVFAYAPNPTGWIDPLGLNAGTTGSISGEIMSGLRIGVKVTRGVPGIIWQAITPTRMGDATIDPLTEEQLAILNASNSQNSIRQKEYEHAKKYCDTQVMPERNDCTAISSKIDHAKNGIKLYKAWGRKWYQDRHNAKPKTWNNRLDSLKEYHQSHYVNKYNYYDDLRNKE